jgi:hypothetical protein
MSTPTDARTTAHDPSIDREPFAVHFEDDTVDPLPVLARSADAALLAAAEVSTHTPIVAVGRDGGADFSELSEGDFTTAPAVDRLDYLKDNPSMALSSPKTSEAAERVDGARTAIRYVGADDGVPKFQKVSTKVRSSPKGKEMLSVIDQPNALSWVQRNGTAFIEIDEDGCFEPTDLENDPRGGD